jgi:adenylate cyclase
VADPSLAPTLHELIAPLRVAHMQVPLRRIFRISAAIHVGLFLLFVALDVWELAAYNLLSVGLFLLAIELLRRGHLQRAALLGFGEVLVHQVLAVHFIGWDAGFQYYILAIAPLELMLGLRDRTVQIGVAAIAVGLFLALDALYRGAVPLHPQGPALSHALLLVNLVLAFALPNAFAYLMQRGLVEAEAGLDQARARSEALLHRVLPPSIIGRLREGGGSLAEAVDDASILFADLVGFTPFAERTPPREVLAVLDAIFAAFDDLTGARGLEKIKTLGDSYMVASGAPSPRPDHAVALVDLALAMLAELERHAPRVPGGLRMRIGVHSGAMIAGVIGRSKFAYDLWGDTVNTAARMESHGEPGRIQVSETTARLIDGAMLLAERGVIEVKGKGPMRTFWVLGRRPESALNPHPGTALTSPDAA